MVVIEAKEFKKKLKCLVDSDRDGWYTIFIYPDDEVWMTAYHEDKKKEYYLKKEVFKQIYKKYDE